MRERDKNRQLFMKGHYEIIAGVLRQEMEHLFDSELAQNPFTQWKEIYARRGTLVNLAIAFARRLQADSENFDPIIFLDRCSPDPVHYPISELWTETDQHSRKV